MNLADVPRVSRYTYRYHFGYEILNGIFAGVFGLADVVARKGLGATETEILILSTASPAFSLLAGFWATLMEGRVKRPYIIAAALLGRGSLLLAALLSGSAWFIALCCAVALFDPIFITAQQAILQANYDASWRGRLHGRITLWTRAALVAASLGAAYLLDRDPARYRWLFPVSAAVGVVAFLLFAFMRVRFREVPVRARIGGWNRIRQILKENRDFDSFEVGFYLYGVAFHMLVPVNVFLLVDHLGVTYTDNVLTRTLVFNLVVAAFSPLAGRLLDFWKAPRTSMLFFALLGFFPLLMLAVYELRSVELLYLAYAWFGVSMAGVNAAWNLGAMQYSGRDDASIYMGIHVSAVGVRGLCAPTIGYCLYLQWGFEAAYGAAAALFFASAFWMRSLSLRSSGSRPGTADRSAGP